MPILPSFPTSFDPRATGFSRDVAHGLALLSWAVYFDPDDTLWPNLDQWGFPLRFDFRGADSQACVAANDNALLVAFRGTERKVGDWFVDGGIGPRPGPGEGRVHAGFALGLDAVWNPLLRCIRETRENRAVLLCGHSLGGAQAMLAAARLHFDEDVAFDGVYTFGQPRLGDSPFCRSFDNALRAKVFRIVNNNDLVVRFPPPPTYAHAGTFGFFDANGAWVTDSLALTEASTRIDSLVGNTLQLNFRDHDIAAYVALLGPAAVIEEIVFDPEGPDVNREFVRVRSRRQIDIDMTGWALRDAAGHQFNFGEFQLGARKDVCIWTKRGTRDHENLYWGREAAVWNNRGLETATLFDEDGRVISQFRYQANR